MSQPGDEVMMHHLLEVVSTIWWWDSHPSVELYQDICIHAKLLGCDQAIGKYLKVPLINKHIFNPNGRKNISNELHIRSWLGNWQDLLYKDETWTLHCGPWLHCHCTKSSGGLQWRLGPLFYSHTYMINFFSVKTLTLIGSYQQWLLHLWMVV